MFNRPARDNILYGRPGASDADLAAAAEKAEAHEFIEELQDGQGRRGYDAYLGERGVKLSGGQRQRIALARAILKDAPILVLDEATSALDSEVEAAIQPALQRVMEGKTVLAIAHRLSTIAQMDRIVVMEAGRIVEQVIAAATLSQQRDQVRAERPPERRTARRGIDRIALARRRVERLPQAGQFPWPRVGARNPRREPAVGDQRSFNRNGAETAPRREWVTRIDEFKARIAELAVGSRVFDATHDRYREHNRRSGPIDRKTHVLLLPSRRREFKALRCNMLHHVPEIIG